NPEVRLTAGSFCEHWAFELQAAKGAGSLTPHEGDPTVRAFGPDRVTVTAGEPLFPGRPTRVAARGNAFRLDRSAGPGEVLVATLSLPPPPPAPRRFTIAAL